MDDLFGNNRKKWLLLLLIVALFECSYSLLNTPGLRGAHLENEEFATFIPIPLPWKNGDILRSIEMTLIVKTNNYDIQLLSGKSTGTQFSFDLSVQGDNLEVLLNMGGTNVAGDLAILKSPRVNGEPFEINLFINFDDKMVIINDDKLLYFRELERNDASLVLSLGGRGFYYGCVAVKTLKISDVYAKLEYETPVKHCDPAKEAVALEEKVVAVEDERGHGHVHDNEKQLEDDQEGFEDQRGDDLDENKVPVGNEEIKSAEVDHVDPDELEKELESNKADQLTDFEKSEKESFDKKLGELADQPEILDNFKRTTSRSNGQVPETPKCYPQQRNLCGTNSRDCAGTPNVDNRNADANYTCVCKPGYAGKRCQFSLLPRSCYEAFALNTGPINEPGAYEIDVDGSGPLTSVWATCARDGLTVVEHNMPNDTFIRSPSENTSTRDSAKGLRFPISYKLFPQIALNHLINNSYNCKQKVTYDCQNSPLSFASNLTWFEVASGKFVKQIGIEPNSCECGKAGCLQNRKCNCDSLDTTSDEGYLVGKDTGIVTVFALNSIHGSGSGKLTLSPLMCEGKAGHSPKNAVTFKSKLAALDYAYPDEIELFEFEFRSIQDDIDSLLVFQTAEYIAKVSLKNGHTIVFTVTDGATTLVETSIMSQSKLNDLYWHRILIEVIYDEVHFAIDDLNTFQLLPKKGLPSNVRIGSFKPELKTEDGFIGCVRNVIINRDYVDIGSFIQNSQDLFGDNCPNLCAGHNCEQESKCIEHFDQGIRSCECKNKFIHKGERCEKNLNIGTDISFHDHNNAYLRYNDSELRFNPLTNTLALTVTTDKKQAVLLYAHDQSDNILQVHLEDEYRVILTLSNYTGENASTIVTCTVFSHKHTEFSDMRWLQIVVERSPGRTTLSVDDEVCEIKGPIILAPADSKINDHGTQSKEVIFPPQAAGIVKSVEPFYYLFIGGVNSPYSNGFGMKKRRSIRPVYQSFIPVFLGCMKGLVVGEQFVNMREGGLRPVAKDAIQPGCHTDCDVLMCHNGGHCTYLWENRMPSSKELSSCDCSKTSFFGPTCMKDSGVTFDGQHSLLYRISKSHEMDLAFGKQPQSFRFAFSPLMGQKSTQRLATAYFDDLTELQITLHENQSINVFYTGLPEDVFVFEGNFTDGYRHFFQATFEQGEPIRVVIDSTKRYFPDHVHLHMGRVTEFRLGGVSIGDDGQSIVDPYYGCMSNVVIDFHRNYKTVFQPLLNYFNQSLDTSLYLIDEPKVDYKLNAATCGVFKVAGVLPTMQRNVMFPTWESVFAPVEFTPNFVPAEEQEVGPEGGLPFWLWILIALAIILIVLALIFYCCCRKDKRPPPVGNGTRPYHEDENIPLKSVPEEPYSPISVEDNFDIPKATQPLFKNGSMLPDRPSVTKSNDEVPPLPSQKEYPDNEIDSMDAYSNDDPNDIDRELANGFGEERPNIMDKNTFNMLQKTSPNRASSFGKDDVTQPMHSPKSKLTPATVPKISTDYLNGV